MFGGVISPGKAQMLFPESYVVIFDTTRHFKGSISPSVELKTPKELYVEINNIADLAWRFKNYGFIIANKLELTKNGNETILSGGYLYTKFKTFYDNPLVLEYYAQYHWAEARGIIKKFAFGVNARYKIYKNGNGGAFIGVGPFYEYELWNYDGVAKDLLPANQDVIATRYLKLNMYLSTQRSILERINLEGAIYLQDGFEKLFKNPRLGTSAGISYQVTKYIAFGIQFRMLYDMDPVVPVDKFWFNTFTELQVTF